MWFKMYNSHKNSFLKIHRVLAEIVLYRVICMPVPLDLISLVLIYTHQKRSHEAEVAMTPKSIRARFNKQYRVDILQRIPTTPEMLK